MRHFRELLRKEHHSSRLSIQTLPRYRHQLVVPPLKHSRHWNSCMKKVLRTWDSVKRFNIIWGNHPLRTRERFTFVLVLRQLFCFLFMQSELTAFKQNTLLGYLFNFCRLVSFCIAVLSFLFPVGFSVKLIFLKFKLIATLMARVFVYSIYGT